jgi:MFS family permease
VPAGRLGDSYGRKKIFLVGLVVFTVGSLGCGLSTTPLMLILTRVLQGLGAGILNPQITAIINSTFQGAERGRAFGRFGGTIGLSTATGPLLGGVIIDFVPLGDPWRYIFLVNIPVAAVAFVLGLRLLPSESAAGRQRLDAVGTVLLGVAVALVLLAIQERSTLGVGLVVAAVAVAAASAWAFAVWERRYAARGGLPLARPGLMRTPGFAPGITLGTLYFAGFTGIFFTVTLDLQDSLHYSPLQAGLTQTPFAIASAISAPLAGRAVARLGRRLVVRGLVMVVAGLLASIAVVLFLSEAVGRGWTGVLLALPLALTGAGSGQVISPNVNLSLANIEPRDAGSASGVFQTFQRLGSGLGIAVVGAVFFDLAGEGRWVRAETAALACTTVLVALALVPAVRDLRRHRGDDRARPEGGAGDGAGDDEPERSGDDSRRQPA